jgi:retron-type reverse transcriptase
MYDFDETVGAFCRERNIAYTRYCDDMTFSGEFDERAVIAFVKDQLLGLGLFLKNRKTAVIPAAKRQTVTGLVVNEKVNIARDYKKQIRQEMYYIKKFGLDDHLKRIGVSDKAHYIRSLGGRIAFVLDITKDNELMGYKKILSENTR